ncbi:MAG: GNAT family N-acetyltransferase [Cyanothece sp. SIO2G6]|nr:GNAT family N-acetyltransferase [Cyanothece sp. SIO2G6]
MMELPREYNLRSATVEDRWAIRRLVFTAGLDPTQIRWSQFWVIEKDGQVVGCGQLRQFEDTQELGSLVIARSHRRQGLGSALTHHLIQQASHPLYLECLGQTLVQFYKQLGFQVTNLDNVPPLLKRKFALTQRLARVLPLPLVVMKHDGGEIFRSG